MQKLPLRFVTSLAVLSLLACETTQYEPRGPSGGYTDFEAQRGVHYVAFEATPGTGYPKVRQYWHRRAAEVCGGPDSYMRLWTFDRDDALRAETEAQIRASPEEIAMAAAGREPDAISGRLLVEGYIVCTAGEEIPDVSQPGDLAPMCSSWEPCELRRAASCEALDFLDRQLGVECTRSFEACLANGETSDDCLVTAEEAATARYRDVAQNVLRRLDLERSICQAWAERGAPIGEPTAEPCRSWTENAPQTEKTAPE